MLNDKTIGELSFRPQQGIEGLERLAPAWTALAESMPEATFVHFPEFYRAYLNSLETDPSRVWFIGAWRGESLVGVFPLQFQSYRLGRLQPHVLGTIEHDEMQSCDFVFAKNEGNSNLLFALTQWLRSQRCLRWDELRLRKIHEDSSVAHAARSRLPKGTVALKHDGSAYFNTAGTFDEATEAMSGTFKRNLRRLSRRAEGTAPLRVQSCSCPEELEEGFRRFVDIEASGWKGQKSSAIRCNPAMLAFFHGLVREFGARNACVINILWHGDEAVAGQFCITIGKTLHILKIGFSDAHASFAPGNLLLERILRSACEAPGIDVVSLVNDPPWARNFKPLTSGVWSYCAPNWNARGLLVHAGLLAKRTWERRESWPGWNGSAVQVQPNAELPA